MQLQFLLTELKSMPMLSGLGKQIEILRDRYRDEYIDVAESILQIFEDLKLDVLKTSRKYMFDYLKQLNYFLENKDYGHNDFDVIREEIYDNEKTMMETYMPGLLLAYAYTTILYEKTHFFLTEFLPRLDNSMKGIEIGFGEGFYIWQAFRKLPNVYIYGYDISPYAVQFAGDLLEVAGIPKDRYLLQCGNVFEGIAQPNDAIDFGVMAELIEHIPNPEIGIKEIARTLKKGGLLYITTVMNSNHMDHISNFESVDVVEKMLIAQGFDIIAKKIYYMKDDFPDSNDISVGMAFVAEKK